MPDRDIRKFESYSLPPGYQIRLVRRQDFWKVNQFLIFPTKPNWSFIILCYLLFIIAILIQVLLGFFSPTYIVFIIIASIINLIFYLFCCFIFLYIRHIITVSWGQKKFRYWIIEYHNKVVGQVMVKIESKGSYLFDLLTMPNHQNGDLDLYFLWNAIQHTPKPIYFSILTKRNLYKPIFSKLGFRPINQKKNLNMILKFGLLSETMVLF